MEMMLMGAGDGENAGDADHGGGDNGSDDGASGKNSGKVAMITVILQW